jgi:hypothetical protein
MRQASGDLLEAMRPIVAAAGEDLRRLVGEVDLDPAGGFDLYGRHMGWDHEARSEAIRRPVEIRAEGEPTMTQEPQSLAGLSLEKAIRLRWCIARYPSQAD